MRPSCCPRSPRGSTDSTALFPPSFVAVLRWAELGVPVAALVAGAGVLVYRFAKSESAIVRQQLKWVVWGSALAITPFTLFYATGISSAAARPRRS